MRDAKIKTYDYNAYNTSISISIGHFGYYNEKNRAYYYYGKYFSVFLGRYIIVHNDFDDI